MIDSVKVHMYENLKVLRICSKLSESQGLKVLRSQGLKVSRYRVSGYLIVTANTVETI